MRSSHSACVVGIDARAALSPKTGDRTYILNLLRGLAALQLDAEKWKFQLLLDRPDLEGVLPYSPNFEVVALEAANSRMWTMRALPRHARRMGLDLVHLQYLAPLFLSCPYVTAIHDVVWRAMPETFPRLHRAIMNAQMPRTARRAARVICGTQSAAQDIAKYLPVRGENICLTPYSIDPRYYVPVTTAQIEQVRRKYELGDAPYVLSVGVLQPRKNLQRLIEAFEQCSKAHPEWPYQLVIVGKKGWGEEQTALSNQKSKITTTGYVDDEDLPALYAGAACFAYPSLYEGFGLPIIEAMACGSPVLTSYNGAMSEVAGGAAQLVDPLSVESIAEGLEAVLASPERTSQLQKLGKARATEFSVEKQAQATLNVYAQTLGIAL
jgi:glycosyltransferase involved in cell wall biosynthesis